MLQKYLPSHRNKRYYSEKVIGWKDVMLNEIGIYIKDLLALAVSNTWLGQVSLIIGATFLAMFIWRLIVQKAEILVERTNNKYDDVIWYALLKPVSWLILLIGTSISLSIISKSEHFEVPSQYLLMQKITLLILLAWVCWRFVHKTEETAVESGSRDITTAQAIGKLIKLIIIIITSLMALQIFGVHLSGLLAFGGMGGLIVGMAAKDLLGNFFGALMIYLDKPFVVGEWIRSPDREIEGTVVKIGWRVTRIQTFDKRPLFVPNGLFSQMVIENATRMSNRRIKESFGIRYQDIHKIKSIIDDVRSMLESHDAVAQDQVIIVNFDIFNNSSLDFFIYAFAKTTDWVLFHKVKEDVMLKIADIVIAHDAEFAFPTRQLHIDKSIAAELSQSII